MKEEAYKLKALSQVREAIVKFFKLNSWQEAETKFGASVRPERLLRFKVCSDHYVTFSKLRISVHSRKL